MQIAKELNSKGIASRKQKMGKTVIRAMLTNEAVCRHVCLGRKANAVWNLFEWRTHVQLSLNVVF